MEVAELGPTALHQGYASGLCTQAMTVTENKVTKGRPPLACAVLNRKGASQSPSTLVAGTAWRPVTLNAGPALGRFHQLEQCMA